MTKKDYEIIAAALRTAYDDMGTLVILGDEGKIAGQAGVLQAIVRIASALQNDNKLFDRTRFVDASIPDPEDI